MTPLQLSDTVILAAIVGLPPSIAAIASLVVGIRNSRRAEKAAVVTDTIHALVNSNMGEQLRLNAAVTRRLATFTKSPGDLEAADAAETLLKEHEEKQRVADQQAN